MTLWHCGPRLRDKGGAVLDLALTPQGCPVVTANEDGTIYAPRLAEGAAK